MADKTVLKADGTSLSYVECTVVDENGNMVPDADNLVKFAVSGKASIVGVDNGKQESAELYKYDNVDKSNYSERTAYNGKVLVILKSEKEAGDALLTISSDNLKPVQVALKVTENGTGDASKATEVTGTEKSVDAVNVTVPTGMSVTLPSVVKVNYTGSAGDYSLLKKVTWSEVKDGKAEGTIEGSKLTAQAAITESDDAATDVELAAGKASAIASFTGSDKNYPQNMLDGDDSTSWTNAYNRGASVLLPANSASRKNEYVEFDWEEAQVLNQITLNFKEHRERIRSTGSDAVQTGLHNKSPCVHGKCNTLYNIRQHGDHRSICEIKYRKAWCTPGTRRRRCCGTGQEPDNERKTCKPFLRQPVR